MALGYHLVDFYSECELCPYIQLSKHSACKSQSWSHFYCSLNVCHSPSHQREAWEHSGIPFCNSTKPCWCSDPQKHFCLNQCLYLCLSFIPLADFFLFGVRKEKCRNDSNYCGLQICLLLWQIDLAYSEHFDAAIRSWKHTLFSFQSSQPRLKFDQFWSLVYDENVYQKARNKWAEGSVHKVLKIYEL